MALIFGTAGAVAGGAGAATGSTAAVSGAGWLSRRLNPVIRATPNATATIAVATIGSHRRCGDAGILIFTLLLVLKELAELDEGVEQGLRDLILVRRRRDLRFLVGVG